MESISNVDDSGGLADLINFITEKVKVKDEVIKRQKESEDVDLFFVVEKTDRYLYRSFSLKEWEWTCTFNRKILRSWIKQHTKTLNQSFLGRIDSSDINVSWERGDQVEVFLWCLKLRYRDYYSVPLVKENIVKYLKRRSLTIWHDKQFVEPLRKYIVREKPILIFNSQCYSFNRTGQTHITIIASSNTQQVIDNTISIPSKVTEGLIYGLKDYARTTVYWNGKLYHRKNDVVPEKDPKLGYPEFLQIIWDLKLPFIAFELECFQKTSYKIFIESELKRRVYTIGRSITNHIVLDDNSCSRFHAQLIYSSGWSIVDVSEKKGVQLVLKHKVKTPITHDETFVVVPDLLLKVKFRT